jgi:hypothetical protein
MPRGGIICITGHAGRRMTMSFLRRLILAISLLMLLGVPLSAMYYEPAQSLPSRADEDRLVQQADATPRGKEAPGTPVTQERQEEDAD